MILTKGEGMNESSGLGAIRSVDYIFILCDDLERMRRFYTDVFDLRIEEETDHMVVYRLGALFFGLRPRGRAYDGPEVPDTSAAVQLSFRVPPADVDLAYKALKARKVDVIEAPTNQDWPHRTLYFSDPENNILEIFADIHPDDTASAPSGRHLVMER